MPSNGAKGSKARDRVFAQLQQWIADGQLQPGEVVRDVTIANDLGVSRTPVREALQMLEYLGAIKTHTGVHTIVATADVADVALVYPVLASLHGLAVAWATSNADEDDLVALASANDEVRAAAADGDFIAAREADRHFHAMIIDLAQNRFLRTALEPVQFHSRRLESLYMSETGPTLQSAAQHEHVLVAMRAADAWTAQRFMEAHWLQPLGQ